VEGGIDMLEHASVSSNEPAFTSTPPNTENTEKGKLKISKFAVPEIIQSLLSVS
jgi:hypothetical protein